MPIVSVVAGRQFAVCGVDSSPRSTSGLDASTAANCGAKPWSEATNVVRPRVVHLLLGEPHRRVGALVRRADVALALLARARPACR